MSDQPNTPEQQAPAPVQQENWEARYKGQQAALQRAMEQAKALEAQLAAKASEFEQLRAQLTLKDTEHTVAVSERDKNLQALVEEKTKMTSRLQELEALNLKIAVAKKLNRPEILPLIDRIPNITDEGMLETYIKDFVSWADGMVQKREKELLAGVTPAVSPGSMSPKAPSSPEAWTDYVNGLPLGSSERRKAMDEYGDWLEKQNK